MNRVQILFRILSVLLFVFVSVEKLSAVAWDPPQEAETYDSDEPAETSTNWLVEAKNILPSKYATNDFSDFDQITNLLSAEFGNGNAAALGLRGMWMVNHSYSTS